MEREERKIRTGIFGGSFNPIHKGHVTLARLLKAHAGLDEVWLMVSPQNPLKQGSDLLDDEARLEMARIAVAREPGIIASDYEMHLPKPSYTWNTLQSLSHDYPDREFVLMIGGDNWTLFDKWYRAEDIRQNYRIVVYPREEKVEGGGLKVDSTFNPPLLNISSTDIRQRIREGRSIRGLVPAGVARIIKERGYYV